MLRILTCLTVMLLSTATVCAAEPANTNKAKRVDDDRGVALVQKSADTRKRMALVIGNSRYAMSPLKNPANDAKAMAATLRRLGFEVEEMTDLGYVQMNKAVESFGKKLKPGGVGVFYYAGHGIQVGGANYLIPVDAEIDDENEVRYKAVDAGLVLAKMEQSRGDVSIVILDACRNNPFARSARSTNRGLASMDAPSGSLIAYATAPGRTAADGDGKNGVYTEELMRMMETPGLTVEEAFKQVRIAVKQKTNDAQVPWEASSLTGNFHFIPPTGLTDLRATPPQSFPQPSTPRGFTDPVTGMEFVPVKGGCFQMGDITGDGEVDEKPVHEVCVDDFAMGKYEVTVAQFRAFVDATGYRTDVERRNKGCFALEGGPGELWAFRTWAHWKNPNMYLATDDRHPVSCVSWDDVQAFIAWLNSKSSISYRLPTEAEWEYAARGGTKTRNYWGDGKVDTCRYANVADMSEWQGLKITRDGHQCSDGYPFVAPVGQFQPNAYGLYDMMGNVWEWVNDWYDKNYYAGSPRYNPRGPAKGARHFFRGAGWPRGQSLVRVSKRYEPGSSELASAGIGFRLVAPVQ